MSQLGKQSVLAEDKLTARKLDTGSLPKPPNMLRNIVQRKE